MPLHLSKDEALLTKIALVEYIRKEREELLKIAYILNDEESSKKADGITLANNALEKIEFELLR